MACLQGEAYVSKGFSEAAVFSHRRKDYKPRSLQKTAAPHNSCTSDSCATRGLSSRPQRSSATPIPFLSSKAAKFKVDNLYRVEHDVKHRQRYAFPLGITVFALIIYFGFLRNYGDDDRSVMEFLTQDISAKIPEGRRKEILEAAGVDSGTSNETPVRTDSNKFSTGPNT